VIASSFRVVDADGDGVAASSRASMLATSWNLGLQ
jgi:hypothetical protein